jgi:hypothetical protein
MTQQKQTVICAVIAALTSTPILAADELETLQQQIETMQGQLDQTSSVVDKLLQNGAGSDATTLGGYGELHYNNLDSGNEIDFHRFVIYIGHEFSDRIRLFSEVELEHVISAADEAGEVELEQAAVEFDISDRHSVTAGLFLLPVGILNETHEPPTFYGVERNPVEKNIIPATWWEGGVLVSGDLTPGWSYDLAVTSGLSVVTDTADGDAYKIRNGRKKVSEAPAEALAYIARMQWMPMAGTTLSFTLQHQDDVTQGKAAKASANLIETHAAIQQGAFGLRALYAAWDIEGSAAKSVGRNEQTGWYVEPSYKISEKWGLFARYNEWDNEAGDSTDSVKKQTDVGINFWPHPQVVIKADLQNQDGTIDDDGFNLGIGYQF